MTYSNLAHIPYTLAVTAVGATMGYLGVPYSFVGATGGLLMCITREVTQREYQIIETLNPPLRSGLHQADAFKFWQWNNHSKVETVVAGVVGYAAAFGIWMGLGV